MAFEYDATGRVASKTDQDGTRTGYEYDLAGRMTRRTYRTGVFGGSGSDRPSDTFTHDPAGRMLTAVSGRYDNTVNFTYDAAGRKATESLTINGQTYTTETQYDPAGRVAGYVYPSGDRVQRTYTDRGQLATVAVGGNDVSTRTYDAGGRLTDEAYDNGITSTRRYNNDNTLEAIDHSGGVGDYQYTWDANKNKTSETITGVMSGYGFDQTGYDAEDRLLDWGRSDGALDQSWDLSPVGDWNHRIVNNEAIERTHGPSHQLVQEVDPGAGSINYQYDSRGNQISRTRPQDYRQVVYDEDNRLRSGYRYFYSGPTWAIDYVEYRYDAIGRRVSRFVGFYDNGTYQSDRSESVQVQNGRQTIADYAAGASPSDPSAHYVWGSYIDELIARDTRAGRGYYHRNQQYSVVAISDRSGSVTERYAYDAYGEVQAFDADNEPLDAPSQRYTYTGREWDDAMRLYHYRARMYDPYDGRFCSRDPIGFLGGTLGLYQYVNCTPAVGIDPDGLRTVAPARPPVRRPNRPRVPGRPQRPLPGHPGGPPVQPLPPGTGPVISPWPGTPEYDDWYEKVWDDYWKKEMAKRLENLQKAPPVIPPPPKRPNCPDDDGGCTLIRSTPPSEPGGCHSCKYLCSGSDYLPSPSPVERFMKGGCQKGPFKLVPGYMDPDRCEDSDPEDPLPYEGLYPNDPLLPIIPELPPYYPRDVVK